MCVLFGDLSRWNGAKLSVEAPSELYHRIRQVVSTSDEQNVSDSSLVRLPLLLCIGTQKEHQDQFGDGTAPEFTVIVFLGSLSSDSASRLVLTSNEQVGRARAAAAARRFFALRFFATLLKYAFFKIRVF